MKAKTFLISYQPIPHRDERCTIGALMFDTKEQVRLHLASNLRKIRAIDPSCNIRAVRDGLRTIADQINEKKSSWIALQAGFGAIRFSEYQGYFIYRDLDEYNHQIATFLHLMVEPQKNIHNRNRQESSRLYLELKKTFDQLGWLANKSEELHSYKVVTPYPISIEERLFAEFAIKNGKLHMVETIDFRGGLTSMKRLEVQSKALVMDFARDISKEIICSAIVAASDYSEIKPSMNILNKYADRVISFYSTTDMNGFFSHWGNLIGRPLLPIPPMHT